MIVAKFSSPLRHTTITQGFGDNKEWYLQQLGLSGGHNGDDYAAVDNTLGQIIGDGETIFVGVDPSGSKYQGGFGTMLKVDHGDGFVSLYGHLSQILVSKGQLVKQGQDAYRTGHSGFVYPPGQAGAHLHLGLHLNGVAVDPALYTSENDAGNETESDVADLTAGMKVEVVAEGAVRIRSDHSVASASVGYLYTGAKFTVIQVYSKDQEIWLKIAEGLWCSYFYPPDFQNCRVI